MIRIPAPQLVAASLEYPKLPVTRTSDEIMTYNGDATFQFTIPHDYTRIELVLRIPVLGDFDLGTKSLPHGLKVAQAYSFALVGVWHWHTQLRGVELLATPTGAQIRLLRADSGVPDYQPLPTHLRKMDYDTQYVATASAVLSIDLRLYHEL